MACVLMFAALAAIAPHSHRSHSIHARQAIAARAGDPPRLSSGYRAVRISLRWQAPDAAGAALDRDHAARPRSAAARY